MTSSEKDTVSMFSGSGSTAGTTRRGLYTILYDTAFNVLELPLRAVRLVTSVILRGDQSRATVRTSRWSRVVVRLDLYLEDGYQPAYGTGFFLHVPGSQKDIIVTAGHNLIRSIEEGRDRVTPKIGVRLIDPDTNTQSTEFVYPASYRISKAYESSPAEGTEADDYGIILLDRRVNADGVVQGPREAFGFNIVLAGMDLSTSQPGAVLNAQIGGYPGMQQDEKVEAIPNFETGNGNFGNFSERVLYYHGGTDQGMSGGPVWVNFLGEEIVVGIHNKHEDIPGEGNRGARLTLPVILDIFKWAGVSTPLLNKAIKASSKGIPGAAAEGYYIQSLLNHDYQEQKPAGESEEHLCYAWSGPIRNPAVTTFDIIPAQASPTYSRSANNTYYVISTSLSTSNRKRMFLEFYTNPLYAPKQVGLTEKPGNGNLVRFVQGGLVGAAMRGGIAAEPDGDKTFKPYEPFRISITQNHDTEKLSKSQPYPEFKLTLWSEDIPPADDTFGLERARLGLIVRPQRYRAKPPCDYEDFQLE